MPETKNIDKWCTREFFAEVKRLEKEVDINTAIEKIEMALGDCPDNDINSSDENGITPLMHAMFFSVDSEITDFMLDCLHADPNIPTNDGTVAIHIAIDKHDKKNIQKLIYYNTNLEVRNAKGDTVAQYAARYGDAHSFFEIIAEPVNREAVDGKGKTIFDILKESDGPDKDEKINIFKKIKAGKIADLLRENEFNIN